MYRCHVVVLVSISFISRHHRSDSSLLSFITLSSCLFEKYKEKGKTRIAIFHQIFRIKPATNAILVGR